jgi:hypothetical protein
MFEQLVGSARIAAPTVSFSSWPGLGSHGVVSHGACFAPVAAAAEAAAAGAGQRSDGHGPTAAPALTLTVDSNSVTPGRHNCQCLGPGTLSPSRSESFKAVGGEKVTGRLGPQSGMAVGGFRVSARASLSGLGEPSHGQSESESDSD